MVSIVPIVTATAALNTAAMARNAQLRNNPRYRKAVAEVKRVEIMARLKEREEILAYYYNQAFLEIAEDIDVSKTEHEKNGFSYERRYFNAKGNLLVKESGWSAIMDEEVTTELYSPKSGEKIFSNRCYSDGVHEIVDINRYKDGVCDTEELLKEHAQKLKRKQIEEEKQKHLAKRRLARMKVKKFLGITKSSR